MDAIKGSPKEKRLASQFISKFFKHFPNLTDVAIDAQIDLCEDEDIQVSYNFKQVDKSILLIIFLYFIDSSPGN